MNENKRTVTILIPCYNEEESLPMLFARLTTLSENAQLAPDDDDRIDYRFLFVDDGSKDSTRDEIREFASNRFDTGFIFLSRNFGKEHAMLAGIDAVDTDALVIIDADLQDPPELIGDMVKLWRQGYGDVYARRRSRKGESWFKKATSHLYYTLLQKVSSVQIQRDTGDSRLLDRKCVTALQHLRESERNSKALFSWIGFKKIEFLYDRDPRCGGIVSLSAIIYALVVFVHTIVNGVDVPGYASLMIVVLVLGGIQLLALGVIGEYLGRTFIQTKNRPNYLIEEEQRPKER